MLVLVIDTAGSSCGVLLARNESASSEPGKTEVLGISALQPREFSRQLIPAIAELLQASQLTLPDVDVFAVVTGPGSFTGLRVGLSAVKALAEVTEKPVIALSQLAIMASTAEAFWPGMAAAGVVHVVLDAGRGEFYHGIYHNAGGTRLAESLESFESGESWGPLESLDTLDTLATSLRDFPGMVAASEMTVLDALSTLDGVAPRQVPHSTVREALPLVFAAWQARRFTDVVLLDANYLRRINPGIASGIASKAAGGLKPADTRAAR